MKKNNGLINHTDLAEYQAIERKPVQGTYRGYKIITMPPPSAGGTLLIQMLNVLENFPIQQWGHNSAKTIDVMTQSMKYAYQDRSKYFGDPSRVNVPYQKLASKKYAQLIQNKIRSVLQKPRRKFPKKRPAKINKESTETTHFSVMDRQGNTVSITYSLNFSYGSGIVIPGTGIIMNNHMNDFSLAPGVPDAYGLISQGNNSIAPKKKMVSSMSPTIIFKKDTPFLITGTPGGSRIITTVLQIIMNVIDHQMNIAEASNQLRFHYQWPQEKVQIEKGLNKDTQEILNNLGYQFKLKNAMGSTQTIMYHQKKYLGASDPRKPFALSLGY
jgi:gamma-glutamyltranspeptidase/glutathione hydrolase